MLGRLAVEILEGRSFKRILEANAANAGDFWADPASFISGDWKRDHQQLWSIVSRLLEPAPQNRWTSMAEVVRRLRALEEEGRALAKRVFLPTAGGKATGGTPLRDNVEFFERFYDAFFTASPSQRPNSRVRR